MNAKLFTTISLALALSAPAFAALDDNDPKTTTPNASTTGTPGTATTPSSSADANRNHAADQAFLDEAIKSGETEVHAAKLAQQRGADEDVRELAELIERDHRELNARLAAAGGQADKRMERSTAPATTPATTPSTRSADSANVAAGAAAADPMADQAKNALSADPHMKPLLSANGPAFDRAYLDMLVQMHRKSIQKFEAAANGQQHSAEVRALAQQALPSLRRHASMAESLDQAMAQQ